MHSFMNPYKIKEAELAGRNFAFKNITGFLGKDFRGQSFFFDGFVFCICIGGRIRIRINYGEYEVMAGEMFAVLPKHIFSVLECSADVDARTVFISLDFMHHLSVIPDFDLLSHINLHPCAKLDEGQVEDMVKIHSVIQRYDKKGSRSKQIQDTLVLSLVLISVSIFEKSPAGNDNTCTRKESLTRSFFNLLLQHFKEERSVSFYADKLCITPKYLTMAVKSVTHHSVQGWINELVLTESKRYLRTTELTIRQISERLNFPTDSAFVRFFRTHTGCTPLEYRKRREK